MHEAAFLPEPAAFQHALGRTVAGIGDGNQAAAAVAEQAAHHRFNRFGTQALPLPAWIERKAEFGRGIPRRRKTDAEVTDHAAILGGDCELLPPIGIGSRAPLHGRDQGDAFFHRTFQRIKRRGGADAMPVGSIIHLHRPDEQSIRFDFPIVHPVTRML